MAQISQELVMAIEYEVMSKDAHEIVVYKELISIAKQNITPISGRSKIELEMVLSEGIFVVDACCRYHNHHSETVSWMSAKTKSKQLDNLYTKQDNSTWKTHDCIKTPFTGTSSIQ
ncbi:hypothetical protein Tco_1241705 [Tanacetum coccineum]